jgi:hypothetical protein
MSHARADHSVDEGPSTRGYWATAIDRWNAFWFTPQHPHTLAVIRIATGTMMLYGFLVLAFRLQAFIGPSAWVDRTLNQQLHAADWTWSPLRWFDAPLAIWSYHGMAIALAICLMLGIATRITAPLAWLVQLSYVHRLTGMLFGFDQVITMLAMYLAIAPSGDVWSVDAWWRGRRGQSDQPQPAVSARIATRLIQIHLCVIYLFGGISKMRGETWWDGTAMWFAAASYEYQSIDLTWLANYPRIFALATHATVFWEVGYAALIWPRWTRPWMLGMAVAVHGAIAIAMGMATFGMMMIIANLAFIDFSTWSGGDHRTSKSPVT